MRIFIEILLSKERIRDMLNTIIIINGFMHDFASAMFLACLIMVLILAKEAERSSHPEVLKFYHRIFKKFSIIIIASLVLVIVFGIIRLLTYDDYLSIIQDSGSLRVNIIAVKHIILFAVFGYGYYLHMKLQKRLKHMDIEGDG